MALFSSLTAQWWVWVKDGVICGLLLNDLALIGPTVVQIVVHSALVASSCSISHEPSSLLYHCNLVYMYVPVM